jgi:ribose transport system permease protein
VIAMTLKKTTAILSKLRPLLILLLVTVVFGILSDRFFTVGNLTNIFKQISASAILASGVYFAILMGGIDISVGSVLGFSGAMAAYLMVHVNSPWAAVLAVAAAIIIGAAAGAANGFFVAKCRLQPMIVTLASLSIFRGATLVLTNGASISINKTAGASAFKMLGQGTVFGDFLPIPIIIMAVIYAVVYYILNKTAYGRHIYAIGGNEDAAYLSGISVAKTKILGFMASGLMAGVAGIIVTARVAAAQPLAGQGYEMDAIAAVVIGGTSLRGGEGHVLYTIIGAVIIGMLNNILNLKDVSSYYQTIIKGGVILAAVLLDAYSKRK